MADETNNQPTGVGRGNGAGSRSTQFQRGAPSPNPRGRPKKAKVRPQTDVRAELRRQLALPVPVTIDGKTKKMPRIEATVTMFLERLSKAPISQLLGAFRLLLHPEFQVPDDYDREVPPEAFEMFLADLANGTNG